MPGLEGPRSWRKKEINKPDILHNFPLERFFHYKVWDSIKKKKYMRCQIMGQNEEKAEKRNMSTGDLNLFLFIRHGL